MGKSSKYWDDRALRRLTGAEKTSEQYIKQVQKMYDRAYRNVNKEIETIYKSYSNDTGIDVNTLKQLLTKKETSKVFKELKAKGYDKYIKDNYKSRITRLEQLKAQIYMKAKDVYTEEELINHKCYGEVYKNSYYRAIYDTQMGTGLDFGFSTIDNNLIETLLNEHWSGKNYKARVWGNTDILAESVSELIGGAILSGQSLSKTTQQIRERFGVGKYYAERLIRTETNHFYNEADAMAYEEMGVDKYVFVAVLDNRTSRMCQDMDNVVKDYKDKEVGVNFPPLHPNCRSTTRGYLGEEAERHLQRRARDPKTGKSELIGNMSYKEWAKTKGIDVAVTKRGGQLPAKPVVDTSKSVKTTPKTTDIKPKVVEPKIKPLTEDGKKAIEYYVSGEGMYLNDYLRDRDNPIERMGNMTDFDKKVIKDLDEALDNPIGKDMTLYRNVDASAIFGDMSYGEYDDMRSEMLYGNFSKDKGSYSQFKLKTINDKLNSKIGKTIEDKGFMSTTKSYEVARDWGDFTGSDKPIVLELKTPKTIKGRDLVDFDIEGDEQKEILLARGVKYKVTGIEARDGNIYVKADVIAEPVKEVVKETVKPVNYTNLSKDKLMDNIKSKYTGTNKKLLTAFESATIDDDSNKIIGNLSKLDNVTVTNGKKSYFTPHNKEISISGTKKGTVYHEWGHSIDYMYSKKMAKGDNFKWISDSIEDIRLSMNKDLNNTIPSDLVDIFNKERNRVIESIKADMSNNSKEIGERIMKAITKKYGNNYIKASESMKKYIFDEMYTKEVNKIVKTALQEDINHSKWSTISDIYDAITNGNARNSSSLIASHGYDYYNGFSISMSGTGSTNKQNAEIFANFVELKLGNYTDQLDYLKTNAPQLYDKLEEIYKQIGEDLSRL